MSVNFYDDRAAVDRYLQHRHSGVSSPNQVMEEPALRRELGDVAGLRILDLGCGDAAIAASLLDAGAIGYRGIDSSAAMVDIARKRLAGRAAQIEAGAIESISAPAGSADLIISRLALHYVDDIDSVLHSCVRALTPGGRLVITVVHPILTSAEHDGSPGGPRTSWLVDDYFRPGRRVRSWLGSSVTWYHRTVETYLTALLSAGFVVTAVRECPPQQELFEGDDTEFQRRQRVPMFLLLAGRLP